MTTGDSQYYCVYFEIMFDVKVKFFCTVVLCLLFAFPAAAQLDNKEIRKGTSKTNRGIGDPGAGGQFRDRNINYIIRTNPRASQNADKCSREMARKMGFEYMFIPEGQATFGQKLGFFFNNFWVKTKLTFTRGPFWKLSFNNKVNRCRKLAGDYMG